MTLDEFKQVVAESVKRTLNESYNDQRFVNAAKKMYDNISAFSNLMDEIYNMDNNYDDEKLSAIYSAAGQLEDAIVTFLYDDAQQQKYNF